MLRDRLGVSERWACRVVGQHRSTQRHEPKTAGDDAALRAELRRFSVERPRWGYRRAHHRLRELGWEVNRKRVQRLWREEGLRVPQRRRMRRRLGDSTVPAERLRAQRPNHVWAFDFQFDQTADGRALKLLNVVDELTRESLVMLVARSIDADRAVSVLEALAAERGAPELLRVNYVPRNIIDLERCTKETKEVSAVAPRAPAQKWRGSPGKPRNDLRAWGPLRTTRCSSWAVVAVGGADAGRHG
jgi:putative transposase